MEHIYTTKDIADMLGVEPVTVRKYAQALEHAGYNVARINGKDRRYTDEDVMTLRYMQTIRSRSGLSVEAAAIASQAKKVADTRKKNDSENIGDLVEFDRYDKQYDALAEQVASLVEMNRQLVERLDRRDEYEKKRDDQVIEMLAAIREQKEVMRQLAAAQNSKRTLWGRIFGGKKDSRE